MRMMGRVVHGAITYVRRGEGCAAAAAAVGVGTMIELIVMLGAAADAGEQLVTGGAYMMLRARDTTGAAAER